MEPLAARIVRRFTASADHVCWYRVRIDKSTARSMTVMVTAAWKPTASTPRRQESQGRGSPYFVDYFVFPDGFFGKVKQDCQAAIQKAQGILEPLGLKLRQGMQVDPELEKNAARPARAIDYVNFFWLTVDVPFAPGQKKLAERVGTEFAKLSQEFADVMSIELERQ